MAKPPESAPHSDMDGVHQDGRSNIDSARDSGQDSGDLERTAKENVARPPYSDGKSSKDNRTG